MLYAIPSTKEERKKLPLLLRFVAKNYRQEPIIRPYGMNIYQWFYCAKGKGEVIIDGEYNVLTAGRGFLLLPQTPHSYRGLTADFTLHIVGFEGLACQKILSILGMYHSGIYYFKNRDIFLQHVENLLHIKDRELKNKKRSYSKGCYGFLMDIAGQITPVPSEIHADGNRIVAAVIAYLERNFTRDFSLDELSGAMNRSKEYLCTIFKKSTGKTIVQMLTDLRMIYARNLLLQYPQKTVGTIAEECGFSNPSYFGKRFKELTGTSPENYRKEHL